MNPHLAPRLQLVAAAALFSTGGAAIKTCGLTSWQVAGFRSGVAALAVLLLIPAARRLWTRRTLAVGLAYAATMILFVTANKLTTAASTIFLQSTAPLYVVLLGPRLLDERLQRRDVPFVALLAAGLALLVTGHEQASASAPDPLRGNVVAAFSGITWALTVIGFRWVARDEQHGRGSSAAAIAAGNLIAFAACLPLSVPATGGSAADWAVLAYLGVFQIALSYLLLSSALRRVGALEASLLLLLEPVLNPVWAWMLHDEQPGRWALIGGAIILAATAVKSWTDARPLTPRSRWF